MVEDMWYYLTIREKQKRIIWSLNESACYICLNQRWLDSGNRRQLWTIWSISLWGHQRYLKSYTYQPTAYYFPLHLQLTHFTTSCFRQHILNHVISISWSQDPYHYLEIQPKSLEQEILAFKHHRQLPVLDSVRQLHLTGILLHRSFQTQHRLIT